MDNLTRCGYPSLEPIDIFTVSIGTQYSNAHDPSPEHRVQSTSEVDDTPGLTALLQQILVLDPLRRPDVSGLLNHP